MTDQEAEVERLEAEVAANSAAFERAKKSCMELAARVRELEAERNTDPDECPTCGNALTTNPAMAEEFEFYFAACGVSEQARNQLRRVLGKYSVLKEVLP